MSDYTLKPTSNEEERGAKALIHKRSSLAHGLRQRPWIDVFEFATDRNAARDSRNAHAATVEHFSQVMRRNFPFVGKVRRQNDLLNNAVAGPIQQSLEAQLARPDSIKRRHPSHEHVIQTGLRMRLFHHIHVDRRFNHAQQAGIALG